MCVGGGGVERGGVFWLCKVIIAGNVLGKTKKV